MQSEHVFNRVIYFIDIGKPLSPENIILNNKVLFNLWPYISYMIVFDYIFFDYLYYVSLC